MEHRGDTERTERADRERSAGGQQECGLDVSVSDCQELSETVMTSADKAFANVRVGDLLNAAFWREVEEG